jgi:MFS family permease
MKKNLLLVAFSLFTWGLGEGFFIYFQPLYLQQWGANSIEIGGILGAAGIVLALSLVPTGLLTDRFGPRNIMISSWILGIIAAWGMVLAPNLILFVVSYLVYNLTGFGAIAMNTYVVEHRGNLSVGRVLTFISGMYNLGAVIGPFAGGQIAEKLGLHSIYVIAAFIFILSTIIIFFTSSERVFHPEEQHTHNIQSKNLLKDNPRLIIFMVMSFATMLVLYLPQPLTSNFLQNQQGLSKSMIGILGAVGNLGNAFAALVLGNIAPFWGLMIGQVWVALFSAIFLFGNSPFWFGLGYFFFGGYRLARSMSLTYARPLAHPDQTGLLFGSIETVNSISVILAPVIAGFLYNQDPYLLYKTSLISILVVICANIIVLKFLIPKIKPERS